MNNKAKLTIGIILAWVIGNTTLLINYEELWPTILFDLGILTLIGLIIMATKKWNGFNKWLDDGE